jgi:hypothetical protein
MYVLCCRLQLIAHQPYEKHSCTEYGAGASWQLARQCAQCLQQHKRLHRSRQVPAQCPSVTGCHLSSFPSLPDNPEPRPRTNLVFQVLPPKEHTTLVDAMFTSYGLHTSVSVALVNLPPTSGVGWPDTLQHNTTQHQPGNDDRRPIERVFQYVRSTGTRKVCDVSRTSSSVAQGCILYTERSASNCRGIWLAVIVRLSPETLC